ncbi:MAG: hypothetical protein JNJ77_14455 [Planctomycetia bacterium]|nr:hypothetical protein [Planctomycetia bacterium]
MAYGDWIKGKLWSQVRDANTIYDNSREWGFGWWFAYFWKEIAINNRDDRALKEVIADVLAPLFPVNIAAMTSTQQMTEANRVAAALIQVIPEPRDLNARPGHYRTMLTKLLKVGFKEMPYTRVGSSDPLARNMFLDRISVQKSGRPIDVAIAYRGDTRPFETVCLHGGAKARADLGVMNMNQPWHPFSDPVVGSKLYARGASGDNCLYSVNSVAADVSIPVGFPLIEDQNIYSLPTLPATETVRNLSKWNFRMLRDANKKLPVMIAKASVSGVPQATGLFLATDTFLYAVRVKKSVHTQDYVESHFSIKKDQCHERGVRDVKMKNFLAGVQIRRIHLGPRRQNGVIGFVQQLRFYEGGHWVTNPSAQFAMDHFYGDQTVGQAAIRMIRNRFTPIILGEADEAPSPMPHVTQIDQWNLTFDQFNAYRSSNPANFYYGAVP